MKATRIITFILAFCLIVSAVLPISANAEATISGSYSTLLGDAETEGTTITFEEEGGARYIVSGSVGNYSATLPAGRYTVTISRKGYLDEVINNVIVNNVGYSLPDVTLLAGDLNGDGIIDTEDIFISERNYESVKDILDFNGNGTIDDDELNLIQDENFMKENGLTENNNVRELLCDYRTNPLGIDYANPYLSWKMDSYERGQKQTGYRVVVSSSREKLLNGEYDMWDKSVSSDQLGITYDGEPLSARSEYFWTVFISDKDGEIVAPGTIASFETALYGDFGTDNKWISGGAPVFEFANGKIEAKLTVNTAAVGMNFCQTEDGKYLMWQINIEQSTVRLRPHYYNGTAIDSLYRDKDLSDVFASVSDIQGKEFTMIIEITDGVIQTYINGTLVDTYNAGSKATRIGTPQQRVVGTENGTLNSWKVYDSEGTLVYEKSNSEYAAQLFRKSFEVDTSKEVQKARLYATSAGCHEMYLNGQRCSDDYLAPGKSEFNSVLYYQSYDVTDLLLEGENTVAAQLGMGWYNGGPIGANYGTSLALKAKLVVTYTDGTEQIIDTDSSWLSTTEGPVTTNKFYIGQYIDARKNIDKWNENTDEITSIWANSSSYDTFGDIDNLVAENTNPVKAIKEVHPIEVTSPEKNVYVYKFPTNMSATLRVTAQASAGTEVNFRYSEMLDANGYADVSHFVVSSSIGDQNGEDKYIFADDEEATFEFSLVYHGYQYVEISGLSEALPFEDITAVVISTDNERTGYFTSSNELLNQFYDNIIRSQESNFVSAITDCPQREKNNWTGDAQIFAYVANYNFNAYNIYRSFQEITVHSQASNGQIPEVVPPNSISSSYGKTPSAWSDTVILIPWQMYFQYGDESFITDSYDAMKKWADYLISTCKDYGYVRQEGWYGDNLAYDTRMFISDNDVAKYEIGTAYSAYSIGLLAKMCGIIGNTADQEYYAAESEKFAQAWRDNFLEEDGITFKTADSGSEYYSQGAQLSYAMGIYYDLYETQELRKLASDKLAELIATGDSYTLNGKTVTIEPNTQTIGFIGYPIFYYTLSEFGNADTVFTLIEQTTYPSILYPVTEGATTIWERYYKGNSLNHFSPGAVSSWFYTDILGITHDYELENVAYRHFVLQPTIGGTLTYAEGSFDSISGEIKSAWYLSDDGSTVTYKFTVPANTSATMKLEVNEDTVIYENGEPIANSEGVEFIKYEDGRQWYELTSGVYEFTTDAPSK